jgi:hypothetical protein
VLIHRAPPPPPFTTPGESQIVFGAGTPPAFVNSRPFATEYRDSTLLTARVVPGRNVISNEAIYSERLVWHRTHVTGK